MIRIIPAIDIIDGQCVRLTHGDYSTKKVYNTDPLEVAKSFEGYGLKFLHLVDLDGARRGKVKNLGILEKITTNTSLTVDFGGGVSSDEDIATVFSAGAQQVNCGSIAVREPEKMASWIECYGDKIILSADVKGQKIAIDGWKNDSGQLLDDFIRSYIRKGIKYVTTTDIATDGALTGPSNKLYARLREEFDDINIIASGGVSAIEDVIALNKMDIHGVIIGKAIYEGRVHPRDLAALTEGN